MEKMVAVNTRRMFVVYAESRAVVRDRWRNQAISRFERRSGI